MVLTWNSSDGTPHTINYQVSGNALVRTADGVPQTLTNRVIDGSVSFSLCGNLLTLVMDVEARQDETQTMSLRTYLRKLR